MSGDVVNSSETISKFWVEQESKIVSSSEIYETNAVYKDDIIYKIERFVFEDTEEQTHLLI